METKKSLTDHLPLFPADKTGYFKLVKILEENKQKWTLTGHFNEELYEKYKQTLKTNNHDEDRIDQILFTYDQNTQSLQAYRLDQQQMDGAQVWTTMYKAFRQLVSRRKVHLY